MLAAHVDSLMFECKFTDHPHHFLHVDRIGSAPDPEHGLRSPSSWNTCYLAHRGAAQRRAASYRATLTSKRTMVPFRLMQRLWTALALVAAAINLAPSLGAIAPERMTVLYGVNLDDANLQILMRHRAVLFG